MNRHCPSILAMSLAALLAACEPTTPAPATDTGSEPITLRLWSHQGTGFQEANEALVQRFMVDHPDIKVEYETFDYEVYIQTLQTSMPAGTEADVITMFGTWVCSYAEGGRLQVVPDDVMTVAQARDTYFDAPLQGFLCNDQLYGLPEEYNLENGGALVNPDLFAAAGVPYPPQWKDFDAMLADAAKLTQFDANGTMTVSGFDFVTADGIPFTFLAAILQQKGEYLAADGRHFTFDTPEARNALQLMVDMVQTHKVVDPLLFNDTSNWVGDAFFNNKVAIGFVGSWAAAAGPLNFPDKAFDYVALPPYYGTQPVFAADSGWGKVVSVHTQHPREAWLLAQYMAANQENAVEWNIRSATIPAMKAAIAQPDAILEKAPYLRATFDLLPYGRYVGTVTDRDQLFYEIIHPHVLDAMTGAVTVDEAIQAIQEESNAMVDAAK